MNEMVSDFRAPTTHFTVSAGLGTGPVPTEPYRSPAYFELERERIFKRAWLCIGRVERLPKPGSYIVQPIEVAKASVLITRTKDGSIKAFHNVCSHRSNTLVLGDEARAMQYGRDRERDVAGYVERIGSNRWRMIMPRPHFESQMDVLELVPVQ